MKKILDIFMKTLVVLTIFLAILTLFKPELVKQFIDWIKLWVYKIWNWNYLIVFISSVIESFPVIWVVVPGQNILLIVGGFFAELSYNNLIYVIILASIWAILWNYIWYILWKKYWKTFFKKYWLWFWIWETEFNFLKEKINKWWAVWIILQKFHNLTRAFIPFIAWSTWMNKRDFIIYNIIWSIIWSIAMIILWVVFAKTYEKIIEYIPHIMFWVLFLVWFYIYKFKRKEFKKYMDEKNKEIESKINIK
jgi:membrane protein DedA with SNARE-associated domain